MNDIVRYGIAIGCAVVWLAVFVPLITGALGFRVSLPFFKEKDKKPQLTARQYIFAYGVLASGITFFVADTVEEYLRWRLLGREFNSLIALFIARRLVFSIAIGAFLGWTSYHYREKRLGERENEIQSGSSLRDGHE